MRLEKNHISQSKVKGQGQIILTQNKSMFSGGEEKHGIGYDPLPLWDEFRYSGNIELYKVPLTHEYITLWLGRLKLIVCFASKKFPNPMREGENTAQTPGKSTGIFYCNLALQS